MKLDFGVTNLYFTPVLIAWHIIRLYILSSLACDFDEKSSLESMLFQNVIIQTSDSLLFYALTFASH
jgi:hypothetical protein